MSCEKFVSLIVLACAVCYTAVAHPNYLPPREVDLEMALNNTVCPIRVVIDVDHNRIPRRIKLLKCQKNPHDWCAINHIPSHECCAHNTNRHILECVEIHDKVLVKYPKKGVNKIYDVAVGCTCLASPAVDAVTIAPPT